MVTLRLPAGERGARLAEIVARHNPDARWERGDDGSTVHAPRLEVLRWMVEEVYWPDGPADAHAVSRVMRHLLRADPRAVRVQNAERLLLADEEEGEQPLLVRFPAPLKQRLARTAEALGMSQNELVVRAVEDLVSFAEELLEPET